MGRFQNVQRENAEFLAVDGKTHHVLVRACDLKALHVENQVHRSSVEPWSHDLEWKFRFHGWHDWMAADVFDGQSYFVLAGFGALVAQAEDCGTLRNDQGEFCKNSVKSA